MKHHTKPAAAAQPRPNRVALNWLLATLALVMAPHVARLPVWLSLLTACLLLWRFLAEHRGWRLPGRAVRLALTALVMFAIYRQYGSIFGRDAGVALLIVLVGLKSLEMRDRRDFALTVFLAYFLVLGGFLFWQSLWVGAYLVGVLALGTAALVRLYQPAVDARYALRLAGTLLFKALPLMLVVYLLFPRIHGSLWGLPQDAYSGLTGMSDRMHPGSIHSLALSDEIAFRVEFEGTPPRPDELYWRMLVFWDSDGQTWQPGTTDTLPPPAAYDALGPALRYTVTLEPSNQPWLPVLDLPGPPPAQARVLPGYTVSRAQPVRERLRYTLVSYPRYRTGALAPAERERALALPPQSARVAALAQRWRAENAAPAGVVQAALDHFRTQSFTYTLRPPLLGADPVDEFMFETRRGFCEHFATAFVALMRTAGVPSRVVAGYQGGARNPAGGYTIVTQADAHAWAEVWLDGRGWVRVDPTAVIAPERIEFGIDAVRRLEFRGLRLGELPGEALRQAIALGWPERAWRSARLYWDAANTAWNRWVLDYGPERQRRLLELLGFKAPTWLALAGTLFAGAVLVVLLLAALTFYRRRGRDPVAALYARFCARLARAGLPRAPHEGPLDFARRASAARPDLRRGIETITQLYVALRYGGAVETQRLRRLRSELRAFRA